MRDGEEEMSLDNFDKLLELRKANPTIPVVPLVEKEGVAVDIHYDKLFTRIGESRLGKVYFDEDRIYLDEDLLVEQEAEKLWLDRYEGKELSEEEENEIKRLAEKNVLNLNWKEVIIVNIES